MYYLKLRTTKDYDRKRRHETSPPHSPSLDFDLQQSDQTLHRMASTAGSSSASRANESFKCYKFPFCCECAARPATTEQTADLW